MRAVDTPRKLDKERVHDLDKLVLLNDVENLFDLIEEHDLLR